MSIVALAPYSTHRQCCTSNKQASNLMSSILCCYVYDSESDFLLLQQGAVTNSGRLISDRQLRLFCFIKLYYKFEPSNLKLVIRINYNVKLHQNWQQRIRIFRICSYIFSLYTPTLHQVFQYVLVLHNANQVYKLCTFFLYLKFYTMSKSESYFPTYSTNFVN
jgi:hypothetical protein